VPTDFLTPLIISGAPRSGTSLLYNLFDGHPEVSWLGDEGFLFEYLCDLGDEAPLFLKALPEDTDELILGIRDKQVMPPLHEPYVQSAARGSVSDVRIEWEWDETAYRRSLSDPRPCTIDELWRWLAAASVAGLGQTPRRFGCMKSPDYGNSAKAAFRWSPNARVLVIVRDPVYALDSLKRSREMRGEKLLTWPLLALQVRRFQDLHRFIHDTDPQRLKVIRYETFVQEAEATMKDVAAWLEIEMTEALLIPTMHGHFWPGISSFAPTIGIQTKPKDRSISSLTNREQTFIKAALSGFRQAFSFE
jgi:hypothetical protein